MEPKRKGIIGIIVNFADNNDNFRKEEEPVERKLCWNELTKDPRLQMTIFCEKKTRNYSILK